MQPGPPQYDPYSLPKYHDPLAGDAAQPAAPPAVYPRSAPPQAYPQAAFAQPAPVYAPPPQAYAPPPAFPPGFTPYAGARVPPHMYGVPVPGLKIVRKPKVWWTIALPLVGALFIWLIGPTLPWASGGGRSANLWDFMGSYWDLDSHSGEKFGTAYAGWFWMYFAFFGVLFAIAAATGSRVMRWILAAIVGLISLGGIGLGIAGVAILSTAASSVDGSSSGNSGAATIGLAVGSVAFLVALVFVVGLFLIRGVAYQILVGLGLLLDAAVHVIALTSLFPSASDASIGAWVAIPGYLLCALGAFIGPRWVRQYARV